MAQKEEQRPSLLFLCQTLPFPPDGGVQIRSYNILRLLARDFDVTAVCFYRRASLPTEAKVRASVRGLREFAEVEAFPLPHEHSRRRLIWDHVRSMLGRRVYTRFTYDSSDFERRLATLLDERSFQIVHVDSLDLSGYFPMLRGLPVVCTHHNVESKLLERRAATERSPILRKYLGMQAKLMHLEERRWCGNIALNIAVSDADASHLRAIVPGANVEVVPNGVDTGRFRPAETETDGIVFVGGHGWYPNRDGMEHFATAILPQIRREVQQVSVTWIGRAPEEIRQYYESTHGIRLTGYVDDISPYVHGASCYIVPLRVGGGTRLKILDAWAMGKAVVSTSVGCEGLEARDGINILIRDDPEEFAAAVRSVLANSALRKRIGAGARETAVRSYDWDVIGRAMRNLYFRTASPPSAGQPSTSLKQ